MLWEIFNTMSRLITLQCVIKAFIHSVKWRMSISSSSNFLVLLTLSVWMKYHPTDWLCWLFFCCAYSSMFFLLFAGFVQMLIRCLPPLFKLKKTPRQPVFSTNKPMKTDQHHLCVQLCNSPCCEITLKGTLHPLKSKMNIFPLTCSAIDN